MTTKQTSRSGRSDAEKRSEMLVSRAQLARLLGLSSRQVSYLEADGLLTPARRGKGGRASQFDASVCVPAYIASLTAADDGSHTPRERRDLATARLTELRASALSGELVSRADVIAAGRAFVVAWRAQLLSLAGRCRREGVPEHHCQTITRLARRILVDIAGWQSVDDAERRDVAEKTEGLAVSYVSADELRADLDDPRGWLQRVQPSLRQALRQCVDEGRGVVRYGAGGWAPWPPSSDDEVRQ